VVDEPAALTLDSVMVINNLCAGQSNGSFSCFISGGIGPYVYAWNGGPPQVSNTIGLLPGGIIAGEVTDINGCKLNVRIPWWILLPSSWILLL
jgi:hypothetical protein